jgi:hypothetical protein
MWFAPMANVHEREMYAEPDAGRRAAPTVDF